MKAAGEKFTNRFLISEYEKNNFRDWFATYRETNKPPEWTLKKVERCHGYLQRIRLNPCDEFYEWIS